MAANSTPCADGDFPRVTQYDLHHRMEGTPGTAILFLTAPACGSCRAMREALRALRAARPDLVIHEADAAMEGGIVREFEVFHLPALFVWQDGRYHGPLEAEPHPVRLARALDALLASPPQEAP